MELSHLVCTFVRYDADPIEQWYKTRETEEHCADDAAEEFAEYAQDNMDMWEHGNEWEGDVAIVVKGNNGFRKVFNITREFDPVFTATECEETR